MTANQEYRRFGLGYFNLEAVQARQFDTATFLILDEAWIELAKESGQLFAEPTKFETRLQRCRRRIASFSYRATNNPKVNFELSNIATNLATQR